MPDTGKIAYDAYKDSAGGVSLASGEPLPDWHEQAGKVQDAWRAAADAVAALYIDDPDDAE